MGLLEHAQLKTKKKQKKPKQATNQGQTFKILFCNKQQPNK